MPETATTKIFAQQLWLIHYSSFYLHPIIVRVPGEDVQNDRVRFIEGLSALVSGGYRSGIIKKVLVKAREIDWTKRREIRGLYALCKEHAPFLRKPKDYG